MDTPQAEAAAVARTNRLSRSRRRTKAILRAFASPLFLVAVFLPTLIATIYYAFIASDVYVSESRFVVRSPQRQQPTGLGAILSGTGLSRSQDDTYSVHDFVLSRDALTELRTKLAVEKMYERDAIDPFSRFGSLDWDSSFEAFFKYYRRHVTVDYDTVSAITILTVRAFSASDARAINDQLLGMGERLVNQLNDRSRKDLIESARKEVKAAEDRAKDASVALSGFRTEQGVFDPDRQAALQLQGAARVQDELLATEAQLAQLRQVSPSNPQIATLSSRAALLRQEVANQNARVAGRSRSFTSQSSGYDRLQLEKTFAERQLATALAALQSARDEAQRQQLYLERLVQPNTPDVAIEPRRVRNILTVFAIGLMVWGVLGLVFASVREHMD